MVKDDASIKIKQELEETRKSEALLASLLENSSQPFGVGYPDGRLGLVNKAFEELTGYSRDELKSTDWSEILTPHKFRDMENEKLEELQSTGKPVRYEKEYIRKDGTRVPIELLVHIVKNEDGTPKYYYSFITDITDRKNAEITLELSEKKYHSLYSSMNEGVALHEIIYNPEHEATDYIITDINHAYETILDLKQSEVVGKKASELYGTGIPPYIEIYANVVEKGEPAEFETFFEPMNKYFRISVVSPEKGKFATIFDDITKRKMAEKRSQELLEKEKQLTEELTVSNEELQSTTEELQVTNEELHQQEDKLIYINTELQKSEQRLRRLYDLGLLGVIYWNMDNIIEDANDKFLEMVGYSREDLKSGLINWSEMTPPEYRYLDERSVVELKATGVNKEPFEKEYIRKDGTRIPIIIAGAMLDDLRFNGVAFVLDITERKKAEEALVVSEKHYRELFNSMTEMFQVIELIYDTRGKPIDYFYRNVNPAFEKLVGKGRDQLVDKRVKDIFGIVEDYWLENYDKVAKTDNHLQFENYGAELDKWYKVNVWKVKENQVAIIFTDITEHKLLEEKLKAARDNLEQKVEDRTAELKLASIYNRSLIEASIDPLVTIGPDGKITDVNYATEFVTGYSRDELIDNDFSDYFTEPERAKEGYQQVFKDGFVLDYPLEIKNKNGHITHVLYNASVYKDESGEVIGVFAAARDITQIKLAEDKLKEYQNTLEDKVKKRTEELSESNIQLKRSNEELERFAYISSHDLQEPLRMVTLYSQLLEKRYKDNLDSDADDFIEYIVEGALHMRQLIDDLLEFSRVKSRAMEFKKVELEHVLDLALQNLELLIDENNVSITHDALPTIFADQNQILQVFQNLITNAIKFHGPNPPEINISAQKEKKEWIFAFKDNGIGINLKHQKQIFEVFKRLHTREEYPGTGIGLSIVQKIIERHNGRIWVKSEPGKGSTFYFTIPFKV